MSNKIQKTITFPDELFEFIKTTSKKDFRNFSDQTAFLLQKGREALEAEKSGEKQAIQPLIG